MAFITAWQLGNMSSFALHGTDGCVHVVPLPFTPSASILASEVALNELMVQALIDVILVGRAPGAFPTERLFADSLILTLEHTTCRVALRVLNSVRAVECHRRRRHF